MNSIYGELITLPLKDDEVFVFGSNLSGYHGGGCAGLCSFGKLERGIAKKNKYWLKPDGWIGKYNIKGQYEGLQQGTDGMSYALPTIVKPGMKRSLTLEKIHQNIGTLYNFARENPDKKFLIAYRDDNNLNGYSSQEMAQVFFENHPDGIPENIYFSESFSKLKK